MKRSTKWITVVVLSMAAAACGGGGGGDPGAAEFLASMQGRWTTACALASSGEAYMKTTSMIDGSRAVGTAAWYPDLADDSCEGDHVDVEVAARFAMGDAVTATLGTDTVVTVTAREVDTTTDDGTTYTILYVDTASTPHRLYGGDLDADPERDGSSPSRRPTVLGLVYAEKQ